MIAHRTTYAADRRFALGEEVVTPCSLMTADPWSERITATVIEAEAICSPGTEVPSLQVLTLKREERLYGRTNLQVCRGDDSITASLLQRLGVGVSGLFRMAIELGATDERLQGLARLYIVRDHFDDAPSGLAYIGCLREMGVDDLAICDFVADMCLSGDQSGKHRAAFWRDPAALGLFSADALVTFAAKLYQVEPGSVAGAMQRLVELGLTEVQVDRALTQIRATSANS